MVGLEKEMDGIEDMDGEDWRWRLKDLEITVGLVGGDKRWDWRQSGTDLEVELDDCMCINWT